MAETTREMVVRLTMDAGGFKKTAGEIDRQIKNIDKEIKGMGDDNGKKSKLEEKLGLQQQAVGNLKSAVDGAKDALAKATTEKDKLLAAKKLSGLETDLINAEQKAAALKNQLAAANLIKFGTMATNFGNHVKSMGRNLNRYVTAPLAALGVGSYKAALDYESATVSMQKTIDETDTTKYEDIKNAFLAMSETGPVGFTELMELAGMAGAFGVGADDVIKFVESVSMLSVTADDLDAATGAEALTKLLNITEQGDYTNIQRVASAVTDLGNKTNATEGQILAMAQRMASTGELAGLSTEGILALAAGFVSVGIEAEAGGTAAGKLMKMMTTSALSDDASKFSEIMGISGAEFAKGWKSDAAGSMLSFFQSLSELDAESDFGALQWLQDEGLKEIRLSNLISAAATNPKLFENALETSKEAYELNAALTEEAEKRYKTGQSYQDTQWNIIQNASAEVGENLVDPFQAVIGKVGELAKAFGELDEDAQNRWIAVAGALIALGPVSSTIGTVAVSVGKIATALATKGIENGGGVLTGVTGIASKAGPILALAAALYGIVELIKASESPDALWSNERLGDETTTALESGIAAGNERLTQLEAERQKVIDSLLNPKAVSGTKEEQDAFWATILPQDFLDKNAGGMDVSQLTGDGGNISYWINMYRDELEKQITEATKVTHGVTTGIPESIDNAVPGAQLSLQKLGAALTREAAIQASLITNAFNSGLSFGMPGVSLPGATGKPGGTVQNNTFNITGSASGATGIYQIRRELNNANNRTRRGYGNG